MKSLSNGFLTFLMGEKIFTSNDKQAGQLAYIYVCMYIYVFMYVCV